MMESFEAVRIISKHRGDALIVAEMTPGAELPAVSTKPEFDLPFNWASMGKGSSLALGLALARPDRKVFVLDGDGSLLMNLGSLVTIAHMAPPNFTHFLFDNRVYRCTGGQPLPRAGRLNFANFAREAGYPNVYEFADVETLEKNIDIIINQAGPNFVCLKVSPALDKPIPPFPYVRVSDAVGRFRAALRRS
jgi:thiamine pyrophosphate-dependent acetolactate synthase large subunit-like protein